MPGKRSNGEGALRKRSSGLWECMIMTGFQPNGKRKYKSFYARTRKEVLQKVRDYQAAIEAGLDMTKKELKFGEWAQSWYERIRSHPRPMRATATRSRPSTGPSAQSPSGAYAPQTSRPSCAILRRTVRTSRRHPSAGA